MEEKINLQTFKEVRQLEKDIREDILSNIVYQGTISINNISFDVTALTYCVNGINSDIRLIIKFSINGSDKQYDDKIETSKCKLDQDPDLFLKEKIVLIANKIATDLIVKDLSIEIFKSFNKK